jgi:hypothetical protein
MEADILAVLDSDAKIPGVEKIGAYYYNFWKDKDHERGLWRRTTLQEYRKAQPQWETVLDLDALNAAEDAKWVWHGADCLKPDYTRCLIALSPGGSDADVHAGDLRGVHARERDHGPRVVDDDRDDADTVAGGLGFGGGHDGAGRRERQHLLVARGSGGRLRGCGRSGHSQRGDGDTGQRSHDVLRLLDVHGAARLLPPAPSCRWSAQRGLRTQVPLHARGRLS